MMEYYWATKNNEIMPFTATQTDLEIIILNKINQVSYDIAYIWNLNKKKTDKNELISKSKRDSQTENKFMVTKGKEGVGKRIN